MADDRAVSRKIRPLTKRSKATGELYFRPEAVERQIKEVLMLSQTDITERIRVNSKTDPRYLFDETIVYLLRESGCEGEVNYLEALAAELSIRTGRIAKSHKFLKLKPEDGEDLAQDAILYVVERIFEESDRADFAEVRFGSFVTGYLSTKRSSLQNEYNLEAANKSLDEENEDGIRLQPEAEGFDQEEIVILIESLEQLPENYARTVVFLAEGFQCESKDPNEITISKIMKVSSKTIRNWMRDTRQMLEEIRGMGR